MIGGLVISHSSIFLHCALKQNHSDHLQFYILALKCATHILCVACEPCECFSIDKKFFFFQCNSCN